MLILSQTLTTSEKNLQFSWLQNCMGMKCIRSIEMEIDSQEREEIISLLSEKQSPWTIADGIIIAPLGKWRWRPVCYAC